MTNNLPNPELSAENIILALGGVDNIVNLDGNISRISARLADMSAVNAQMLKSMGMYSVVIQKDTVQLIIGKCAEALIYEITPHLNLVYE